MAVTIGDVYACWTVERTTEDPSRYACRCKCGRAKTLTVAGLVRMKHDECRCRRTRRKAKSDDDGPISSWYFELLEQGAKRRGIPFEVDDEFLGVLWEEQGGRCWYTGLNLVGRGSPRDGAFTASLDRSDSNLGYVAGNLRWTHKIINQMKQTYSPELFVWMCQKVAENHASV